MCGSRQNAAGYGASGIVPKVGLYPTTPQNAAGMRTDPAASVPIPMTPSPKAVAAAAPPLLPPAWRVGSRGFKVTPLSGFSVNPFQANSGGVVFPRKTAPAERRRATEAASLGAAAFDVVRDPRLVGQPATLRV